MKRNTFWTPKACLERQNIMNDIFNPHTHCTIVYIDDVLIFSNSVYKHFKHLHTFLHVIKENGFVYLHQKRNYFKQT